MKKTLTKKIIALSALLALSSQILCSCTKYMPIHTLGPSERDDGNVPAGPADPVEPSSAQIRVSELMVHNKSGIKDGNKRYGWIEIANLSSTECELGDYSLLINGTEWKLPGEKLASGEYKLFFASGKDKDGYIPFELPESATIKLMLRRTEVASYTYSNPTPDSSYDFLLGCESSSPTPGYYEQLPADKIEITEVMTKNLTYIIDGELCDWFELYNSGDKDIDLSLFFASDKKNVPFAHALPNKTLAPGGYCLVACTGENALSLSEEGDSLFITRADGVLCASLEIPAITPDHSFASGAECDYPTPGYANQKENNALVRKTPKELTINEIVSSNTKTKKAPDGNYYDIIELYNNSGAEINLADYCLSDKRSNPTLFALPEKTLEAGGFYTVYAAGKTVEKYPEIASFSVSSDGEALYVAKKSGEVVDAVFSPYLPCDVSYGRYVDSFLYYKTPTVGASNGAAGNPAMSADVIPSVASGTYAGAVSVTLSASDAGDIYYTTDGSKPSASHGKKYSGETITVAKTGAVRAVNIKGDLIPSRTVTFNYIVNEPAYTLGIIKITVDQNKFDSMYANFLQNTEIEANVAYYLSGNEEFNVNCGLKLSGRSSLYFEKKSFLVHFRAKYGSAKLNYKMFDNLALDEFNTLVIRSGSAGALRSRPLFSDEFITSVVADSTYTDLLVQGYKPVDVYVNDKYYGIYFVREKINQSFVASHDNVDKESVSVIEETKLLLSGNSWQGYKELWQFVCDKDLTVKENYDYVAAHIDLESVADYYIVQAWCCQVDSTNFRMYKSAADDGKWRMIVYDCDMAYSWYAKDYGKGTVKNMLEKVTTKSASGMGSYNIMISKLLKNKDFRAMFFSRLAHFIENDFATENVLPRFNAMCDTIRNDMQYNVKVWTNTTKLQYHTSVEQWEKACDTIRTYWLCDKRLEVLADEFIEVVGLTDEEVRTYMGEKYVK